MSNLMIHAGGRVATLDEVRSVNTPSPLGRWHPTAHATVLDSVRETLTGAGYRRGIINSQQIADVWQECKEHHAVRIGSLP